MPVQSIYVCDAGKNCTFAIPGISTTSEWQYWHRTHSLGYAWRTPKERNAHPHMGATGKVVLVHNGIVEKIYGITTATNCR
ncbi:MAG: hypothetical protein CM1200mP6_10950 [Anaerolineaceae bacterium]|nr:MAG: hypothetical protein CM1200mP6_10950 [Anaerolineaceae bacterium]